MRTFKDIRDENVTISEMKRLVEAVKKEKIINHLTLLEDFLEAVAVPFYSQNNGFAGYHLYINDISGVGSKWSDNGTIGLKSARNYMRGFKTIEPIQKICYELGFSKFSVSMTG